MPVDKSAVNVNVTVDDFDSVLSYAKQSDWETPDPSSPSFKDGDASPWWMGTYHQTNVAGASVSFNFTGPEIYIYGHSSGQNGAYSVTIDSNTETKNATTDGNASTSVLLYANTSLSYGFHQLTLTNLGDGGDAGPSLLFDYIHAPVQLAPAGATVQNVTFEEDNPALKYSGTWDSNKSANFSGGGTSYTHEDKASVTLSFNGSAVYVFGDKKNDHGNYSVVLDNRPAEIYWGISGCGGAYGLTCEQQKPTLEYFASNLDESTHKLTIANIGGVHNSFFDLDSIVVTVPSEYAPRELNPALSGATPTSSNGGPSTSTSPATSTTSNAAQVPATLNSPVFFLFGLVWLLRVAHLF